MKGSGKANYYLDLAREDYYLEGGEPPGKWVGQGAEAMGLSGKVNKEELSRLLNGRSPDGTKKLVQNADQRDRQSGWDLTFSAPKSVSVAWAAAPPQIRGKIKDIQQRAAESALEYLQAVAGVTRRGKEGIDAERARLIIATFEHGTSRAQDPDLHTHALVLNIGLREDGTTGTIRSFDLFRHKMAAGAFYRAELAALLQQELGFEIENDGRFFRLAGIPELLCGIFSTRRKEIEEALAKEGVRGPEASKLAALKTRSVKEHVAREKLFEKWGDECQKHGLTRRDVQKLIDQSHPKNVERAAQAIIDEALESITTQRSYFTERDLVRRASELAPGSGVLASQIRANILEKLNSDECVFIGKIREEAVFTTKEILLDEKLLMGAVAVAREKRGHIVPANLTQSVLQRHPELSVEQSRAIRHITTGRGDVSLVCGMAGTGKSTMLNVAREVWEKAGYRVVGASLSAKAARGLEESSKIKSSTIAKLLIEQHKGPFGLHVEIRGAEHEIKSPEIVFDFKNQKLAKKTILVIDEAGMVGTNQMKALMDEALKAGAKVVLVGDDRQLQPIEAGAPFRLFLEKFKHADLTEIKRQAEPWAREMVKLAADGKGQEVLKIAKEMELLHTAETPEKIKQKLINHWKGSGVAKPEQNLILAATREDVAELNRLAQDERIKAGKLSWSWSSCQIGDSLLRRGDRVLFTKNSKALGVDNGTCGTITKIKKDLLTVKLESGKITVIPTRYYQDIQLGYAMTTHKAQGMTVRNNFVLLGETMQDRELSYVQASRAKGLTRFYVDEKTAGKDFENIANLMSQGHQKQSALGLLLQQTKDEEDRRRQEEERLRREEEIRRAAKQRAQEATR